MLGLLGGFFGGDAVTGDVQTYAISSELHGVDVEISAADFTIRQGENSLWKAI